MSLRLITAPEETPVTLDEAKAHLRLDSSDDDDLVESLIAAATAMVENLTQKRYITQQVEWIVHRLYGHHHIRLPLAPVASVEYVKVADQDGDLQTFDASNYIVSSDGEAAIIFPKRGVLWPICYPASEPVVIGFTVGTEREDVPDCVKQAIKLLVGHLYANREAVDLGRGTSLPPQEFPFGVSALLLAEMWS